MKYLTSCLAALGFLYLGVGRWNVDGNFYYWIIYVFVTVLLVGIYIVFLKRRKMLNSTKEWLVIFILFALMIFTSIPQFMNYLVILTAKDPIVIQGTFVGKSQVVTLFNPHRVSVKFLDGTEASWRTAGTVAWIDGRLRDEHTALNSLRKGDPLYILRVKVFWEQFFIVLMCDHKK